MCGRSRGHLRAEVQHRFGRSPGRLIPEPVNSVEAGGLSSERAFHLVTRD